MAANVTVTLQALITGLAGGQKVLQPTAITSGASVAQITLGLSSGFQSLAVPTGAVAAVLVPPAGNTTLVTLKGVTGDTGIAAHKTNWTFVSLDSTQTTLGLTAALAIAAFEVWWL